MNFLSTKHQQQQLSGDRIGMKCGANDASAAAARSQTKIWKEGLPTVSLGQVVQVDEDWPNAQAHSSTQGSCCPLSPLSPLKSRVGRFVDLFGQQIC